MLIVPQSHPENAGEYNPDTLDYIIFAGACGDPDYLMQCISHEELHKQFHWALNEEWCDKDDHFIINKLQWEELL